MTNAGLNHRYMVRNFVFPAAAAWDPTQLPNLVAWYDSSVASSITSSGGAVSQWNDLSGNGHHLTQSTGAAQPTTGSATINGLNVIRFSKATNAQFMVSDITAVPSQRTVFSVTSLISRTTDQDLWVQPGEITGTLQIQMRGAGLGNGRWAVIKSNVAVLQGGTAADANGAPHQRTFFSDSGVNYSLRVDQASDGSTNSATTIGGSGTWNLGSTGLATNNKLDCDVAEQIICSSIIAGADLSSAESYLKAKWGTP